MSIPFTQYLMPDGRKKQVDIERPADVEEMARAIIDAGYRFECEILRTGEVSLTVYWPDEEEDVDIELTQNGPGLVGDAVDLLVNRAHAALVTAGRRT